MDFFPYKVHMFYFHFSYYLELIYKYCKCYLGYNYKLMEKYRIKLRAILLKLMTSRTDPVRSVDVKIDLFQRPLKPMRYMITCCLFCVFLSKITVYLQKQTQIIDVWFHSTLMSVPIILFLVLSLPY